MTLSNCIFACDGVTCSKNNPYSFQNVICTLHLKEIFGLKIFTWKSETQTSTDTCGPYLTPDDHYGFAVNQVIIPEQSFLDGFLMPSKSGTFDHKYHLNPRLANYYNNLSMKRMTFGDAKVSRYHYELIRNLFETEANKIGLINNHDAAHIELKKHLQNRITTTNHWIESEPYFENFKGITVKEFNSGDEVGLETLSRFIGFIIYNCMFDKNFLIPNMAPLMIYGNLAYVKGVGLVAINEIRNNVPLSIMGDMNCTYAYVQQKTHSEPKQVVANRVTTSNFPDTMRSLNVISSSDRYCSR